MLTKEYILSPQVLFIVLSLVAGVAGTALGGVVGVFFKNRGMKTMSRVLSFAGGVMAGIVCFEMAPEAIEMSVVNFKNWTGVVIGVASTIGGMLVVYGLNKLLDIFEGKREVHRELSEIHHETAIILAHDEKRQSEKPEVKRLFKAGIIMLIAIALHNFPEGMAIGAMGATNVSAGVLVAILIAVHNIPEGVAISAPLAAGGMGSAKAVLMTGLAGASTVVGTLLGLWIGGSSTLAAGICIGIAGGAMLYVTFGEILPEAVLMDGGKVPAVSMLVGIVAAMVFVFSF